MSLIDRLKPRWQHSDPNIRADAVRQLSKEDLEVLTSIASTDPDARVRRIAVKKLEDPRLLLEIGQNDPEQSLRQFASERAGQILLDIASGDSELDECRRALELLPEPRYLAQVAKGARLEVIRREALARLSDEKWLADVARDARDAQVRSEALSRLENPVILRTVAQAQGNGELALAAVEKLEDPEALHEIAEARSAPKAVRRRAREKRDALIDDQHPLRLKARREALEVVCSRLEELSRDSDVERLRSALTESEVEWAAISATATADSSGLEARYSAARKVLTDILERHQRRQAEREREEALREARLSAREKLLERVEELVGGTADTEVLARIESEWAELGAIPQDADELRLEKRFRQAIARCRGRIAEADARREVAERFAGLASEAARIAASSPLEELAHKWKDAEKRWDLLSGELSDPSQLPAGERERFETARKTTAERIAKAARKREEREEQTLRHLEQLCADLSELSAADELNMKRADHALREAQSFLKGMGPLPPSANRKALRARLAKERKKLFIKLQEAREVDEWRRWANVEIQQKLIERARALLDGENLKETAQELRAIQKEWKRAGAVPSDRAEELWEQFKKVRSEVRARCATYFTELDKERTANLARKQALCERVEELTESADWEKTAEVIKSLQKEWKRIGPVPRKTSETVWKRFRRACDRFFERRKEHYHHLKRERDENLKKKEVLCERAEALAVSSDWKATATELKRLQAEWKRIGAVPRKKADAVWERFRTACDRFFDRYKHRDQVTLEEHYRQKDALCAELETLLSREEETSGVAVAQRANEAWSRWTQIGDVPEGRTREVEQRFADVLASVIQRYRAELRGTTLDPLSNLRKKEKLCRRLEDIVDRHAQPTGTGEGSLENLAARLQNALAANAIGGPARGGPPSDWREVEHEVAKLRKSWERLAPVPGPQGPSLEERFRAAYRKFLEARPSRAKNVP